MKSPLLKSAVLVVSLHWDLLSARTGTQRRSTFILRRAMRFGVIGLGCLAIWFGTQGPLPGLAQEEVPEEAEGVPEEEQAVAVRIYLTEESLPLDNPFASEWEEVPASDFKVSPQVHWPERLLDATVKSVRVRGLHDGESIAILVEYQDPTQDAADAAAIEFMVGDTKAHFAHGQEMLLVKGGPVNIWYWKNNSDKAVDMSAQGFGTLGAQEHQDVSATGEWREGTWRVVFSRSLETTSKEQDVQILLGQWKSMAFAMWDGKLLETGEPKEKGSQKAVSSWWYVRAEPPPDRSILLYAFIGLGIAALFEVALIWKLRKG